MGNACLRNDAAARPDGPDVAARSPAPSRDAQEPEPAATDDGSVPNTGRDRHGPSLVSIPDSDTDAQDSVNGDFAYLDPSVNKGKIADGKTKVVGGERLSSAQQVSVIQSLLVGDEVSIPYLRADAHADLLLCLQAEFESWTAGGCNAFRIALIAAADAELPKAFATMLDRPTSGGGEPCHEVFFVLPPSQTAKDAVRSVRFPLATRVRRVESLASVAEERKDIGDAGAQALHTLLASMMHRDDKLDCPPNSTALQTATFQQREERHNMLDTFHCRCGVVAGRAAPLLRLGKSLLGTGTLKLETGNGVIIEALRQSGGFPKPGKAWKVVDEFALF
mmetsp:Transcript_2413/g.7012  ORF Transcript_2413/g.7012 Transcript_2413/m.7012 type:complete len:335 (-) Transcript_2413:169-1173(-)|eukprot:CAMPEP_0194526390 /NCGR_PEP_ID=MMETSP0253-20130528/62180_1 /TAXON_ID=2966 /ORGANISM="Noctiluca scintillans" /LENGTH=334 /DNA_ID=CAMNT_0039371215 /DNA_START=31 /DNA_END=1035 /DNA_ORIENTATION=+